MTLKNQLLSGLALTRSLPSGAAAASCGAPSVTSGALSASCGALDASFACANFVLGHLRL